MTFGYAIIGALFFVWFDSGGQYKYGTTDVTRTISLKKQTVPRIKVITKKNAQVAISIGYPTYNMYETKKVMIIQLIAN